MRKKLRELIIHHDTHTNGIKDNDEHPNEINNIDTDKNSDVSNNYTLRNDVNNSDIDSNNFNNNIVDNNNVNKIDAEKSIDNVKLCYNCKRCQSDHLIKKYSESLMYSIQFIQ